MAESSGDNGLLTLEPPLSQVVSERPWPNPKLAVPSRTTNTAVRVVHLPMVLAVKLRSFRFFGFIFTLSTTQDSQLREDCCTIPIAALIPTLLFALTDSFEW